MSQKFQTNKIKQTIKGGQMQNPKTSDTLAKQRDWQKQRFPGRPQNHHRKRFPVFLHRKIGMKNIAV